MKLYSFAGIFIVALAAMSAGGECADDPEFIGTLIDSLADLSKPGSPGYIMAKQMDEAAGQARTDLEGDRKSLSAANVNRGDGIDTSVVDAQITAHPKSYKPYYEKAALQVAAGKSKDQVDDTLDGADAALGGTKSGKSAPLDTETKATGKETYLWYLASVLNAATPNTTTSNRVRDAFCIQLKAYKAEFGSFLTKYPGSGGDVYFRLRLAQPTTTALNSANCPP